MQGRTSSDEAAVSGVITGVSVSHDKAALEEIDAASPRDPMTAMRSLLEEPEVKESFILSTCNRAEWFVVTDDHETGRTVLEKQISRSVEASNWLTHEAAIEHLLRVGAGLESMVLGEDQILGQLRSACREAETIDALGPLLEPAVWQAIRCGERVRTETAINEGVVSLGRAAVNLASRDLPLSDSAAMVIGAGEMGRLTAVALADVQIDQLRIANRTESAARELADTLAVPATVLTLDDIPEHLPHTDLLVTATTSPTPILNKGDFLEAGETLIIDLGQPRDVDPRVDSVPGVQRIDLDDLEAVTAATRADRAEAAAAAESIVAEERRNFQIQLKREQADHVIASMYEGAEAIKQRELSDAISRLEATCDHELSIEERDVLEGLANAMVGQLLAAPTKSLREAAEEDDWETIQTALQLFDPSFPDGSVTFATQDIPHEGERVED